MVLQACTKQNVGLTPLSAIRHTCFCRQAPRLAVLGDPLTTITVRYSSRDGVTKTRSFKTLTGASRFAKKWVGETVDIGPDYAVSLDGLGVVRVAGCTLQELFAATPPRHPCDTCHAAEKAVTLLGPSALRYACLACWEAQQSGKSREEFVAELRSAGITFVLQTACTRLGEEN